MADSTSSCPLLHPTKGDYRPSKSTDIRSPCPMINCLANHGYLPRDGRNVLEDQVLKAMDEVGMSKALGAFFAKPVFLERPGQPNAPLLTRIWRFLCNPWMAMSSLGVRPNGQTDPRGRICLHLNQLGTPGALEHDISLTRHDYAEEGHNNIAPQADLVQDLLDCSSDGGKTLTAQDLAELRKRRIAKQKAVNPALRYGLQQDVMGCTEIGLVLDILGNGKSVRHDYAKAFFLEERLPFKEGWTKRKWWTLGLAELGISAAWIKSLVLRQS